MVTLEDAARRLHISLEALLERLVALGIAMTGLGKRARITEADIDRLAAPIVGMASRPIMLPPLRSIGDLSGGQRAPSATVVPFRR